MGSFWGGGKDPEQDKREQDTGYRPPRKPAKRGWGWLGGSGESSTGRLFRILWNNVDKKKKKD